MEGSKKHEKEEEEIVCNVVEPQEDKVFQANELYQKNYLVRLTVSLLDRDNEQTIRFSFHQSLNSNARCCVFAINRSASINGTKMRHL